MAGASGDFVPWCDRSTLNFASLTAKLSGNIGILYSPDDPVTGLGDAQVAIFRQHLPDAKLHAPGRGHYMVPELLPQDLSLSIAFFFLKPGSKNEVHLKSFVVVILLRHFRHQKSMT